VNKATAALYTYTPWVGAYAGDCGRKDVGGSSKIPRDFDRFRVNAGWADGTPPPGACYSATLDRPLPSGACVRSASDAKWRQCVDGAFTAPADARPAACTQAVPFCYSVSLNRLVAPRTCVQSVSDEQWRQCLDDGTWALAPRAEAFRLGEGGALCASLHPL
jgi:hypothetical protein